MSLKWNWPSKTTNHLRKRRNASFNSDYSDGSFVHIYTKGKACTVLVSNKEDISALELESLITSFNTNKRTSINRHNFKF